MKDIAESGTAGVTVDGIRLIIDEGCEIEISSFDDPFCTTLDGTQATGNSTVETAPTTSVPTGDVNYNIIIYTILGTVVIGIIAILVTICVCSRIGHKKKYILRLGFFLFLIFISTCYSCTVALKINTIKLTLSYKLRQTHTHECKSIQLITPSMWKYLQGLKKQRQYRPLLKELTKVLTETACMKMFPAYKTATYLQLYSRTISLV